MDSTSNKAKVALIAGPTGSGKSALALRLARRLDGTIVNADSAQVYRDLRVLSARPSAAEEGGAPHRLFGYIDGAEACSAARWAKDARAAIAETHAVGGLPILVGGTGLYQRTLLDGIAPIPEIDPAIRAEVRGLPVDRARVALAREDPEAADRLGATDTARIARALEVVRSTGKPIAAWRKVKTGGIAGNIDLHPLILLPDREWLNARCDRRFEEMLDEGAVAEVESLIARNLDPELPVMRAIGVRAIAGWLAGNHGREEAVAMGQLATRQYAKRQYTWFRRQAPQDWPRADEGNFEAALIRLEAALR